MAFGQGTISGIGGAVESLFAADSYRLKAQGKRLEAQNYDEASDFSTQNAAFTKMSTDIKESQMDRQISQTIGGQVADVAGAGFAASGSALDIMRDSASQGALSLAVTGFQGMIQEEGYKVQAQSYERMADASRLAADADDKAATGAMWSAGFKAAGAVASIFT